LGISLYEKLNDSELFEDNQAGEYSYYSSEAGKGACGVLALVNEPVRNPEAQRAAGGEARRGTDHTWGADDGGHIIGARFGGLPTGENLVAQNRNFNRGEYKRLENHWAEELEAGNKVYVNIEYDSGERPETCVGFAIIERPSGHREVEYYSMYNESAEEREAWEVEFEAAEFGGLEQSYDKSMSVDVETRAENKGTMGVDAETMEVLAQNAEVQEEYEVEF